MWQIAAGRVANRGQTMGWLEFILLAIAVAVTILLVMAMLKPDTFRVERKAVIGASPETIFPHLNDLEAWQFWSPWAKKDPNAKASFGDVRAGLGASFGWEGNAKVGKGRMTIIETRPSEKVAYRLEFEKPFKGTNIAEFSLRPQANGTEVTWAMHGPANLVSKFMDVLMNMDKMVGNDFEAGLASLKALVERR
jgi:hypothetical protein